MKLYQSLAIVLLTMSSLSIAASADEYPNGAGKCGVTSKTHTVLMGKADSLQRLHAAQHSTPLTSCVGCHGADLKGTEKKMGCSVTPPSCYTCHGANKWDTAQKKAPATHTVKKHAPGREDPIKNGCTTCHGKTLKGGNAKSCTTCHDEKWN